MLTTTETAIQYDYDIGEEVVITLDGVEVRNADGRIVPPMVLPSWAIGEIVGRRIDDEVALYRVAFRLNGRHFECGVEGDGIEGTA